jgi:hypothetical protein
MNILATVEGTVESVLVCDQSGQLESTRKSEVEASLQGFPGDRHYGFTFPSNGRFPEYPRGTEIFNTRMVSILSVEEIATTTSLLGVPELLPEWYGANLVFSGIPALTQLPPGTRLFFEGTAVLLVRGDNAPCMNVGRIVQEHYPQRAGLGPAFVKAAVDRRGLVAFVERPGTIRPATRVRAEIPDIPSYAQYL